MFRSHHGASGLHSGYGSCVVFPSSVRREDFSLSRQLASPRCVSRGGPLGEGLYSPVVRRTGNNCQSGEVIAASISSSIVSRGQDRLADFPGFADSFEDRKVLLNSRRISVLKKAVCDVLESCVGSSGLSNSPSSRWSPSSPVDSVSSEVTLGFSGRVGSGKVGRLLTERPSLVVRQGSAGRGGFSLESHLPELMFWLDASDQGWGSTMVDRVASGRWTEEESRLSINVIELLAVERGLLAFLPLLQSCSVAIFCNNTTALSYLHHQAATISPHLNSNTQRLHRWAEEKEVLLFPQFVMGNNNVVADSLSRPNQVIGSE